MHQINNHQWNGIVDLTNVTLMHGFDDVKMNRADIEVNLSVGEDGFTVEVIPAKNQQVKAATNNS